MKRLASILLVAAALGSCSKRNTDSPTPPAPSTSQISLVPSQEIDYISKIEEYQVMDSQGTRILIFTRTFEYDGHKRLIAFSSRSNSPKAESYRQTISYGDRTITLRDEDGMPSQILTLDPQGRVSKHEDIYYKKNKEGVLVQGESAVEKDYTYDSKGYYLSHTSPRYDSSAEWQDGNLVKRTYSNSTETTSRIPEVLTHEYSSIPNRSFPDLNFIIKRFVGWTGEPQPYLWSHIQGLRSAKLISSQALPLYENDGTPRGPMESRWAYKLDAKGRPIDLEMSLFFHNFYDRGMAYVITYLDK
nr:hypothetical protein [uncultured Porphyromonas sp.]